MDRVLANSAQSGALVLVAHSLGNIIATKLAARHPERLRALVLVDHALRVEDDHRDHLVEAGRRAPRKFPTLAEGLVWAGRLAGGAAADPGIVSGTAAANVVADGAGYRQAFDQGFLASLTIWDSEPEMRLIEAPVLIVRAGLQPVLREPAARRMLAGFANAELVTVLDAGHNVFIERPAEFSNVVLSFLDRAVSNTS
jgi:pimeloyl-ACP methyl ester carboxylesterase